MKLRELYYETNQLLADFSQLLNKNIELNKSSLIERTALLTTGELEGVFANLVQEYDDSDVIYKLNHTIDLTGSLIFWIKNLESNDSINSILLEEYQTKLSGIRKKLQEIKKASEKNIVPDFQGEWLLVD